jgi:hypothetical protein
MRNAAAHASTLQTYGDVLALQQTQLGIIQNDVSDGNARLCDRLDNLKDRRNISTEFRIPDGKNVTRTPNKCHISSRNSSSARFRLPLMAWLAGRTWEISVCQSQASWTLQIHTINYRAPETLAFQFVRAGNVTAVERLLRAGELSIWDMTEIGSRDVTLLGVSMAPIQNH